MDPVWKVGDADSEDEESSSYEDSQTGTEGIIFLIDASEAMFVKNGEETPFSLCLKCAKSTLMNKVISSHKDKIGIVLFGTEKHKSSSDFNGIYVFQELESPSVTNIKNVEELTDYDGSKFKKEYGHGKFSLADALWACSLMFSKCKVKLGYKRVLLFTNNDDPHSSEQQLRTQASVKAKDLHDVDIEIDLMHITHPDKGFDAFKFYHNIIKLDDDEAYGKLPDSSEKFEELLTRVRAKFHKKRPVGKLEFSLSPTLKFGVSVFNLVRQARKPGTVRLSKADNEELQSKRFVYAQDNAEILMPADIKKYQEYAGRKIYFENHEVKKIKTMHERGIHLLGFKPLASIKPHHYIKNSSFLYPDEKSYSGSIQLFSALLQRCKHHEKVPVCWFVPRNEQPPRLVYLLPQEEELDENGVQTTPPGFHIIYLPFTEDIRKLDLNCKGNPDPEAVKKAKEIAKKLKFPYHPDNFENPELQQFWRYIEALALDMDEQEPYVDLTRPKYKDMTDRAGKAIEEFKKLVLPDGYDPSSTTKKRPAAGTGTGGGGKRAKANDIELDVDIRKEAQAGKLGSLTVKVLQSFCKKENLKCPTKKADLINTIKDYLKIK